MRGPNSIFGPYVCCLKVMMLLDGVKQRCVGSVSIAYKCEAMLADSHFCLNKIQKDYTLQI